MGTREAAMGIGKHETPLDFMLAVMGNPDIDLKIRMDAAVKAARYTHCRLHRKQKAHMVVDDPNKPTAEICEELRYNLYQLGVAPSIIEAIVGPSSKNDGGGKTLTGRRRKAENGSHKALGSAIAH